MKQIGKIGKRNIEANKILKNIYEEKGIIRCEICGSDFILSFHHRHKRIWYLKKPELLSSFNQTILLDLKCHQIIEYNHEKHKYYFNRLRGEEV